MSWTSESLAPRLSITLALAWRKSWVVASTPTAAAYRLTTSQTPFGERRQRRPPGPAWSPAPEIVAQEQRRQAVGARFEVRPDRGQRLVVEEDDPLLAALAGDERLAGVAVLDVRPGQVGDLLAAHAGREEGADQGPVAQQLQAGAAAVPVARRQLQAVDVGDDPDQALVDAGRAVRHPPHHLADVVSQLLERDVGREEVAAGAEAQERPGSGDVGGDSEAVVAAVDAGQPEVEALQEVGADLGGLERRRVDAGALQVLVEAAERGAIGGGGPRRAADQAVDEPLLGDGQRDAALGGTRDRGRSALVIATWYQTEGAGAGGATGSSPAWTAGRTVATIRGGCARRAARGRS